MREQERGPGRPREIAGPCQLEGCHRKATRRAFRATGQEPFPPLVCGACYQRNYRKRSGAEAKTCSWSGCRNSRQWNRQSETRPGYCRKHEREYLVTHPRLTAGLERLANRVVLVDGCLEYLTGESERERGEFSFGPRANWLPYRFVYTALVEVVPASKELDHLCGISRCVNPFHLDPVSPQENKRREQRRAEGRMDRVAEIERRVRQLSEAEDAYLGIERFGRALFPEDAKYGAFATNVRMARGFRPRTPDA